VSSSDLWGLLERLSVTAGVSGDEGRVRDLIWKAVEPHVDAARIDPMGSLLVEKRGRRSGPRVLLDAHMDEVGFMVTGIDSDGCVRFERVGGIDERLLPGSRVLLGADGVPGVIGLRPVHLCRDDERCRVPRPEDLRLDIGAGSREEAERAVRVGDRGVWESSFAPFGDGLVRGRALDDRVGCALVASLLDEDWDLPLAAAFTVQEEVGLRGAAAAAFALRPEIGIAVETTTCADVPGVEPQGQVSRLGDGPVLTVVDGGVIASPRVVQALAGAAERAGVPHQWKRAATGGTDAARLQAAAAGAAVGVVSVPARYIHAPCAVASRADVEAAAALLRAYLQGLSEGRWWP
jgi:putative aminopeptidase FrvX